jgi:YihY family inner membrane protein
MSISERLKAVDRFQQRRPRLAFVAAVIKKFTDDQGGQLAALMAYYAFVSIFPLLLVFVTILGFVLHSHPEYEREILHGTLGQFPILSEQLHLHSLSGSAAALVIGLLLTLLSGLGFTNAAQNAFNAVWSVPRKHRPDFLKARLRGLVVLAILGTLNVLSTVVAGFVGTSSHGTAEDVGGIALAFLVNLLLFGAAFRILTATDLDWHQLWPGVVLAAVFWQLLQHLGGFYVAHTLKHTQELYGFFAIVLGLIAWLYLGAQLTLLAAEVNVVRARRLWPRSFFTPPLLDADKRTLSALAEAEERVHEEDVDVSFRTPD